MAVRPGYRIAASLTIDDTAWTTVTSPFACEGFRFWALDGSWRIRNPGDSSNEDTIAAGDVEEVHRTTRTRGEGPLFLEGDNIVDVRATTGSVTLKRRFYGPRTA